MTKIFGYVRESTMQQAMYGYNIEEQKRVIEDYCKHHYQNYELEIFEERGKSARSLNRPELRNLMDTVKKARANKIVFHSLDRLTRDIKDLYMLIEFFDKNDIEMVSVMESLDLTSAIGRSHVYNSGVYAQLESERTSERTIRALKQGVYEGNYPFAGSPFGYEKRDKKLYPSQNEKEIEIVRFIFNSVASNQFNFVELSRELKKRFNFTMDDEKIKKLVQNEVYVGRKEYRGVVNNNYCEPIVSDDVFKRANSNALIKKGSRKNVKYLFKNIVRCSNCDSAMTQATGTSKHKKVYSYYVCPVCGGRASQTKIIEREKPRLQGITNQYFKDKEGFSEKKEEIDKLRKKQQRLVEDTKEQCIEIDDFYEIYMSYDKEINELQKIVDKIDAKDKRFDYLEYPLQRDIINRYVKEVDISFNGKKYGVNLVRA